MKLLDFALIGVFAVIRLNRVILENKPEKYSLGSQLIKSPKQGAYELQ